MIRSLPLAALFLALSGTAHAFVSVQDTGDVLKEGTYRGSVEPQFLFSKQAGANIAARLDAPVSESSTARGLVSVGSGIDFHTGAFYKWAPVPDYENQPAIAGQLGVVYARYDGEPEVSFRFNPIISKRFESEHGTFTPYGSIPLALETRKGRAIGTAQLAAGTQYQPHQWDHVRFSAELGLSIKDSYNYAGLSVIFDMDEEKGFRLRD